MSEPVSHSRRRALQMLSTIPMLPFASSLAGLPLVADANPANGRFGVAQPITYSFGSMPAPSLADAAQIAATYVASTLTRTTGPHHAETYNLGYETFFLTGDTVPARGGDTIVAGGYFDIYNASHYRQRKAERRTSGAF